MLEVFADSAGLRLELETEEPAPVRDTGDAASDEVSGAVVDVNTADFDALQTIPHVGPERARAIMAMRPLDGLEDLTGLDGIGPKRLEEIRASGVACGRGSG
jgi:competence ComEA-like helix-hairpin-helix protein